MSGTVRSCFQLAVLIFGSNSAQHPSHTVYGKFDWFWLSFFTQMHTLGIFFVSDFFCDIFSLHNYSTYYRITFSIHNSHLSLSCFVLCVLCLLFPCRSVDLSILFFADQISFVEMFSFVVVSDNLKALNSISFLN